MINKLPITIKKKKQNKNKGFHVINKLNPNEINRLVFSVIDYYYYYYILHITFIYLILILHE